MNNHFVRWAPKTAIRTAFLILTGFCMAVVSSQSVGAAEIGTELRKDGLVFLNVSGEIEEGDVEPFAKALVKGSQQGEVIVVFDSQGGAINEAFTIGRLIRNAGALTLVKPKGKCYSACVVAFAGGKERLAEDQELGLHQFWFAKDALAESPPQQLVQHAQLMSGQLVRYFSEMGIDPEVVSIMSETPADQMLVLTAEAAKNLRLTWLHDD